MSFAKGSWSSPTKGSGRVTSPGSSASAMAASAKYLAGKGGTTNPSVSVERKVSVLVHESKVANRWRIGETSGNQPSEDRGFPTAWGFICLMWEKSVPLFVCLVCPFTVSCR